MNQIHRKQCPVGEVFYGPNAETITFGWQEQRQAFSLWYADEQTDPTQAQRKYCIVGTGVDYPDGFDLIASCVMPDGFTVIHLMREKI